MTEYDFSEEGYRRHMETQSRVSNWAHQTARHMPANPFLPSETSPELRSDFYANASHSRSSQSISSSGTARPTLRRSHTSPHRDTSRRHDQSTSSSNHTRTRSSATTTHTRPHPTRSHTTHESSTSTTTARAQPVRSKSTPLTYECDIRGKKVSIPASKHGYTYIVIPRHGSSIKVVSPTSSSRIEYSTSPSKTSQPPLLKRIFGSIVSGSNSDARSVKSGSSRRTGAESGGKPRRSRRGSY